MGTDLLDVNGLEEPNFNPDAIDRLVMKDESDKNMIKAICQKYTQQEIFGSQLSADFIAGKGEGQIFLFHGPPGVGKTLTAGEHY